MASTGKKWLIGCGAGCGLFIVLSIVLFVGSGIVMMRPMDRAVDSQEELVASLGYAEDFQPGPDSLRPERLEAFLRVREGLMGHCEQIRDVAEGFAAMDAIDEKEDPGVGEILKGLGRVMGSVKGMVTEMGAVLETRNAGLLAEDMNHWASTSGSTCSPTIRTWARRRKPASRMGAGAWTRPTRP